MAKINQNIFKAYDIRGIYPGEINEEAVYKIGRAYLDFIKEEGKIAEPKIVVGRDARISSPMLCNALQKGITEQGGDVFDIGLSTTPMLYFGVNFLGAHGGIMITASHNPAKYNGLKLTKEKAISIYSEAGLKKIQEKAVKEDFALQTKKEAVIKMDIKGHYLDFLTEDKKIDLPGKIVVDAGNGMAGLLLPEVLARLKINYTPLYFDLDGAFPNHEANPLKEETLKDLKKKVKEEKALLGVAFDGDGDRVGFITENGEYIRGDHATAIFARELLNKYKKGSIVYGLTCSRINRETIEKAGGRAIVSKIGYPHIKALMRENYALFGGEISSHFYFPFDFTFGRAYFESGILAMIKMLDILAKTGRKPSELLSPLKKYFDSGEVNFEIQNKEKMIENLEKTYKKEGKISKLDGLTVECEKDKNWFWFNVRPSNTEPLLRFTMESNQKEILNSEFKKVEKMIFEQGGKTVT